MSAGENAEPKAKKGGNVKNDLPKLPPAETRDYEFGPWMVTSNKSHILQSKCTCPANPSVAAIDKSPKCSFCRYEELKLPQLPDMVFPENLLLVKHKMGFGIAFQALDALKQVNDHLDLIKVACASAWRESRSESEHINEVIKPFDWTFATDYKGTLTGDKVMKVVDTDERIDMEKLKEKEKIMFYEDVTLFEDELHDHGCAISSVKIRVMPTSLFLLLRFYLRVDEVLIRINDTRLYHETNKEYMLREYTSRESKIENLEVPASMWTNPNEISPHLPLVESHFHKLEFPS